MHDGLGGFLYLSWIFLPWPPYQVHSVTVHALLSPAASLKYTPSQKDQKFAWVAAHNKTGSSPLGQATPTASSWVPTHCGEGLLASGKDCLESCCLSQGGGVQGGLWCFLSINLLSLHV